MPTYEITAPIYYAVTITDILLLVIPFIVVIVGLKTRNGFMLALAGMMIFFLSFFLSVPFWFGTLLFFLGIIIMFVGVLL